MAYSMFSKPKLPYNDSVTYYPEFENLHPQSRVDFEKYNNANYMDVNNNNRQRKMYRKGSTSMKMKARSEQKCPIYVHQFNKEPEDLSMVYKLSKNETQDYADTMEYPEVEPHIQSYQSKPNYRIGNGKKSVVMKLEENYWAHWKPTKNHVTYQTKVKPRSKNIVQSRLKTFENYEEKRFFSETYNAKLETSGNSENYTDCTSTEPFTTASEELSKNESSSYRDTTSDSQQKQNNPADLIEQNNTMNTNSIINHFTANNYYDTSSSQSLSEPPSDFNKKSYDHQEIQTEVSLIDEILTKIDEEVTAEIRIEQVDTAVSTEIEPDLDISNQLSTLTIIEETKTEPTTLQSTESVTLGNESSKNQTEDELGKLFELESESKSDAEPNAESSKSNSSFLKHTDSFILTKRKQSDEKSHFQQPRCIRLYKKPGTFTVTSFTKGGTYPLKSCLKKESGGFCKASIRLGRPGSPLIVSNYFKHSKK